MPDKSYQSMNSRFDIRRRDFMKLGGAVTTGIVLGTPTLWARDKARNRSGRIKTNIEDAIKVPRTAHSLPGPFPGRVVEVNDDAVRKGDTIDSRVVRSMFYKGVSALTMKDSRTAYNLFFEPDDVIGIKVNPVGAGIISTHVELVDAIIGWLTDNGSKRANIIIWDRFDYMLADAGYTRARFPGIGIEGLQTMDEAAAEGKKEDNSQWLNADGSHVSVPNFDRDMYYWADVEGPKDDMAYLNQHVFNGKYSYFGKLLTKRLTKIINVPAFKNTGGGVSMATKNMGYGAVCNTNRLHRPLFFDVCTEVLAFPVIRDKMVLNINDGITGQYDGGPMGNAKFAYPLNTLYFATDPFAMDRLCQKHITAKRKSMGMRVNENPRYTEYLRYAEKLGLGIGHLNKIKHIKV
jgi:hypothetical protein